MRKRAVSTSFKQNAALIVIFIQYIISNIFIFKVERRYGQQCPRKLQEAVESCFKPIPSDQRNNDWQIDIPELEDSEDFHDTSDLEDSEDFHDTSDLEDSEDFHDTSDLEDSDNFDENRRICNGHMDISDNIFLHYDTNYVDTPKIDRAIHKLNKQFLRFRRLEKRLWKCKSSDFKLLSIKTKHGRRYVCSFCKFTAISWGKGHGHIRQMHTGRKLKCKFCSFESFNPDSFSHHKKRHL